MKAIHLVPASVLALAVGVTGMAALAQDGQRQGATNAPDPFMIDFKWEAEAANVRNTPAPPQMKFDGVDGESNGAVARNPTATSQSTQPPKPDNRQGNSAVSFEDVLLSSQVVPATPRDVGSGKAPEAPQPDGFITGVPDLPSVATSTPSSTAQNARGKWEVSEYDALHDQSSGNRRAGQIMAGPGDGAAGPLTATSNTTIQSPPQAQAQYNPKELQVQSPRDPASGQAIGTQSPRDAASGQASTGRTGAPDAGNSFTSGQDTRMDPQVVGNGTAQAGNGYLKIEGIDGESKVNAAPGAGDQFIGGGSDGQGIRKPRPNNRPRKGKRMHKP